MKKEVKSGILTVDAGGTKADWSLILDSGTCERGTTPGINASRADEEEMCRFAGVLSGTVGRHPAEIHYFGAGCASDEIRFAMARALSQAFGCGSVEVNSDLAGASLSLSEGSDCIVCILGTGSNSGLFMEGEIVKNIPPLGYILGDEGSGTALGKRVIADFLRGIMPQGLARKFRKEYGIDTVEAIENVYRHGHRGGYLASFVPFLGNHRGEEYVETLLEEEFGRFFDRNIRLYGSLAGELDINFTGSVAWHFRDAVASAAETRGYRTGRVTRCPMDGLIAHFQRQLS